MTPGVTRALVLVLVLALPIVLAAIAGIVQGILDRRQRDRELEEWLATHEQFMDGNY